MTDELDLEEDWVDIRPRPYPQLTFRWDWDAAERVRQGKPTRGVEELAARLGCDVEVLQPGGPNAGGPMTLSLWFRQGPGRGTHPLVRNLPRGYSLRLVDMATWSSRTLRDGSSLLRASMTTSGTTSS